MFKFKKIALVLVVLMLVLGGLVVGGSTIYDAGYHDGHNQACDFVASIFEDQVDGSSASALFTDLDRIADGNEYAMENAAELGRDEIRRLTLDLFFLTDNVDTANYWPALEALHQSRIANDRRADKIRTELTRLASELAGKESVTLSNLVTK